MSHQNTLTGDVEEGAWRTVGDALAHGDVPALVEWITLILLGIVFLWWLAAVGEG